MKAYDFEYDGKKLSSFGCIIVSFDDKGLETVDGMEINFNTIPSLNGSKHRLISTTYEDCLTTTIQIAKYSCNTDIQEISSVEFREISSWLNRHKFLKFKILDKDHIDLYYMASVVSISKIELDGRLMGLELNIITNSPHALKEPKTVVVQSRYLYTWEKFYVINGNKKGESTGRYATSYNRNFYPDNGIKDNDYDGIEDSYYYVYVEEKKEFHNKHSINDTSYEEGHIYPYTEIVVGNIDDIPEEERNLRIHNAIENRDTYIANVSTGEIITMDYPVITSSDSSHNIQNDFNWQFFRVANTYGNSRNDLTISLPCTIKIKYSPIVKVGL